MEGRSGRHGPGAGQLSKILVGSMLVVALFASLLLSGLPAELKRVATGIALVSGGLAVAAGCWHRHRLTAGPRRRRAWVLFGTAAVLAAGSNLSVLVDPSVRDQRLTPGDVSLTLCLVLGIAGLLIFPKGRRRGTDLTRMVLDGTVIGGSLMFIATVTVFPETVPTGGTRGLLVLLVPILDTVIATLAALLLLRGAQDDRRTLGLAGLGFACYAASDFAYAARTAGQGGFVQGSVIDLGWIVGYLLIALAVLDITPAQVGMGRPAEISPVIGTTVVFTVFLLAAGVSLTRLGSVGLSAPKTALGVLVLLTVIARQVLLIVDNERLRRILEQRVIDRSRSLRRLTQQGDLLLDSVGDGIYGVDPEGVVTFANPAAARALGVVAPTLIGQDAHQTFHGPGPDGEPVPRNECYVTAAIRSGVTTQARDDSYLRADGVQVPVEVTATPLYEEGRNTGAVVVFRDVTQRREVDRLKSEFVSMVSHELRTPLAAIRGSLGLISGGALGPVSPSAARMVEIALLSSDRLTRLINDILETERIESGVVPLEISDLAAATLVDAAVAQVQVLAEEAGITVRVGPVHGAVRADADRVVQTLLNLLSNAIKFSSTGGNVCVRAEPYGAFVEFQVCDTGRGIPADKLESVFTRFVQVDSSDAREKGGSGLGLAISRNIVDRLGGRIWATNNSGPGATFSFTLPIAQGSTATPGGPDQGSAPEAGAGAP